MDKIVYFVTGSLTFSGSSGVVPEVELMGCANIRAARVDGVKNSFYLPRKCILVVVFTIMVGTSKPPKLVN